MYIVSSLEASNVYSYRNLKLELGEGFTVLVGPNGAGKSSVIETIYYALTLDESRQGSLINRAATSGHITLKLRGTEERGSAELNVRFSRSPSGGARLQMAYVKVDGVREASRKDEYKSAVARLLGLTGVSDYGEFLASSAFIFQGALSSISLKLGDPKSLKELLDAALASHVLEKAADSIGDLVFKYEEDGEVVYDTPGGARERLSVKIKNLDEFVHRHERVAAEAREKAERLAIELSELDKKLLEAKEELKRAQAQVSALQAKREELKRIEALLREKRDEIAGLEKKRSDVASRLDASERELDALRRKAQLAELESAIAELRSLESEYASKKERLSMLKRLIDVLGKVKLLEDSARAYHSVMKALEEARERRLKLEREAAEIESRVRTLEEAHRRVKELISTASIPATGDLEEDVKLLELRVKGLEREVGEAEEELKNLELEIEKLKAEHERLRDTLRLLSEEGEGKCPLCGAELSGGRLEELKSHISEEIRSVEKTINDKTRIKEILGERLESLRKSYEKAYVALERVRAVSESVGGLERLKELDALEARRRELRSQAERLRAEEESYRRELEILDAKKAQYERLVGELGLIRERLGIQGGVDEAKSTLAGLEKDLEVLANSLAKLRESIVARTGARSVKEAAKTVEEAKEAARLVREREETVRLLREELAALDARIEELEAGARKLDEEARRLGEEVSRLGEAEELAREAERRVAMLEERVNEVRGELKRLELEAKSSALKAKLYRRLRASIVGALAVRKILLKTKEAAYYEALRILEDEMNNVISRFGLNVAAVRVEATRTGPMIKLVDAAGREAPVSSLSGGERTVVALSFILALNKAVGSKIGFLMLDEPTSELDEARRRILVEVLRNIASEGVIRQLVMVTHHEDVIDMADYVCRVERELGGYSQIECGVA